MTYGGIFPIAYVRKEAVCYHCGRGTPLPDHFAESMGDYFHGNCVAGFLATPRGSAFIVEGYVAYINAGGILKKLA